MPTEKNLAVLEFIIAFKESHGYPPTIRQIMKGMGYKTTSAVKFHLDALDRKGLIEREPRQPRAIKVN